MSIGRRTYAPLCAYLTALPPEQRHAALTFAALEALLGRSLAFTARAVPAHWTTSTVAVHHWHRVGWTAQLGRHEQVVRFTRR